MALAQSINMVLFISNIVLAVDAFILMVIFISGTSLTSGVFFALTLMASAAMGIVPRFLTKVELIGQLNFYNQLLNSFLWVGCIILAYYANHIDNTVLVAIATKNAIDSSEFTCAYQSDSCLTNYIETHDSTKSWLTFFLVLTVFLLAAILCINGLLMKHSLARRSSFFFVLLFLLLSFIFIAMGQHYLDDVAYSQDSRYFFLFYTTGWFMLGVSIAYPIARLLTRFTTAQPTSAEHANFTSVDPSSSSSSSERDVGTGSSVAAHDGLRTALRLKNTSSVFIILIILFAIWLIVVMAGASSERDDAKSAVSTAVRRGIRKYGIFAEMAPFEFSDTDINTLLVFARRYGNSIYLTDKMFTQFSDALLTNAYGHIMAACVAAFLILILNIIFLLLSLFINPNTSDVTFNPSSPFSAQFPLLASIIARALSSSLFDSATGSRLRLSLPSASDFSLPFTKSSQDEEGVGHSVSPSLSVSKPKEEEEEGRRGSNGYGDADDNDVIQPNTNDYTSMDELSPSSSKT